MRIGTWYLHCTCGGVCEQVKKGIQVELNCVIAQDCIQTPGLLDLLPRSLPIVSHYILAEPASLFLMQHATRPAHH